MKLLTIVRMAVMLAFASGAALFSPGCETSSPDTFIRNLGFNFTGFYRRDTEGNPIPLQNSGAPVTSINMRQTGDQLEAVDNNGNIFRGSIGEIFNGEGSFQMTGQTTAGQQVTMSGTLASGGTDQTNVTTTSQLGTMRGTWIEPGFFSSFFAIAVIPGNIDTGGGGSDTNGTSLAISPDAATLNSNGQTQLFSASGGSGTYTWSTGTSGSLNTTTGASVTYTRVSAVANTITVNDGITSVSAAITQP